MLAAAPLQSAVTIPQVAQPASTPTLALAQPVALQSASVQPAAVQPVTGQLPAANAPVAGSTTTATTPITGAAARKRDALRSLPALTDDDQEEETGLDDEQ